MYFCAVLKPLPIRDCNTLKSKSSKIIISPIEEVLSIQVLLKVVTLIFNCERKEIIVMV